MIRAHNSIKVLITGTTGWLGGELAMPEAEQKAWLDGVSFPRAAGCVGYDIVRATDAADHFVVIESWPSKGARLAHTLETDSYEESVYSDATVEEVFRGPGT